MEADPHQKDVFPIHPRESSPQAWYGTIIGLCAVILFGGFFISRAYLSNYRKNLENWRPGKIARLEQDLVAVAQDGRKTSLGELRGKVFVAACQYPECPSGCEKVAKVMRMLLDEFGVDPRFHLVSISVDPASDTPEKTAAWIKTNQVDPERWWFLSSDPERINKYLSKQFGFSSPGRNTDPERIAREGAVFHDHRLFIVDGEANIRGHYGVIDPIGGETAIKLLKRDLDMVLHPEKNIRDYEPIPFPPFPTARTEKTQNQ